MKPGIHLNIDADIYHSWPYCSASRLNRLKETSPAHVAHEMKQGGRDPTPAMLLGTAIHAAVLEPDKFRDEFVSSPYDDFRSKDAKGWRDKATAAGRSVLDPERYQQVLAAAASVFSHASASKLLGLRTMTEASVVWVDETSSVKCKARCDAVANLADVPVLLDLKTTSDASAEGFAKSIFNFGYHRQVELYLRGLRANGVYADSALIIAVETTPPHAVQVFRIMDAVLEHAQKDNDELLMRWNNCEMTGHWHGYAQEVVDIALPDWVMKRIGS